MSVCRGRLLFETRTERRGPDLGPPPNLCDSDGELDSSLNDASMESQHSPSSEKDDPKWDPSFESPAMAETSPQGGWRRSPRRAVPKMFSLAEDSEPEDEQGSPGDIENVNEDRIPPVPPSPFRSPFSPPHKKLRSLRLYDTPHTPKSLLAKAQRRITRPLRNQLPLNPLDLDLSPKNVEFEKPTPPFLGLPRSANRPQANINPFTPNNNTINTSGLKRPRSSFNGSLTEDMTDDSFEEELPIQKKLALREINTSRYNEEFYEVEKLGDGEFGSVYKCIHRLDGCIYAIKKSKMPVAGSFYERTAMNEVYAHAVLGKHPHVVRYYSAWAEKDHMYIQDEYCDGGSLADVIIERKKQNEHFTEDEVKTILLQVARGLHYIHSQNLVHLDIKPGNVFLQNSELGSSESSLEAEDGDEEESLESMESSEIDQSAQHVVTFKIGDLGHVTSLTNPQVEEGDCRYLPREILQEGYSHLSKADIFSLALTIWETASFETLPKNGDQWHEIREGNLPVLSGYSTELNSLLKSMVHSDPQSRPSAASLSQHPVLCPYATKTRAQLRKELNEERFKNELLKRKLKKATASTPTDPEHEKVDNFTSLLRHTGRDARLVGKKINRSMSLTAF